MYSSSTYSGAYRRTAVGASGLPMASSGAGRTNGGLNNRSSFNSSSSHYGKDPYKVNGGTTLASAARNGVMGQSSSLKSQNQ